MRKLNQLLPAVVLGLALSVPASAAAAPARSRCIAAPTGGGSFNTFVFLDMPKLNPEKAVAVDGVFFTGARLLAPVHGTIVTAPDESMLIGLFVHATAQQVNDFTVSGVLDANFAGSLRYDNDGDFTPNGTLAVVEVDCATIDIPWPSAS